ncbi:MAG: hypothetical protein IJ224_04585 [Lachnospiraceae bacterium]|nr:hypothetical protein [Lachnospiraceae bacterium]
MDNKDNNSYSENFVAFLDILGFKNIINTHNIDEVFSIFSSIINDNQAELVLHKAVYSPDEIIDIDESEREEVESIWRYNDSLSSANIYIMSDSIVVAVPCIYEESLAVVIDICDIIQQQLLSLDEPVLLRGAIAKGDFYIGDNKDNTSIEPHLKSTLVFGKGLVDAYVAQEYYAVYPRVIISDEVKKGYSICTKGCYYELPRDKDGYTYINSIEKFLNTEFLSWDKIEASEQYKKLNDKINDNLSRYIDAGVRDKYIWIRNEINRIKKNKSNKN